MSASIQILLWCVAQVAAMCVVSIVLARVAGRRNPSAGVWCLRTGVVLVVVLTVMAPVRLPGWFSGAANETGPPPVNSNPGSLAFADTATSQATAIDDVGEFSGDENTPDQSKSRFDGWLSVLSDAFRSSVTVPADRSTLPAASSTSAAPAGRADAPSSTTTEVAFWIVAGALAIGLLRLLIGIVSVRSLIRRSTNTTDARAAEMLDVLAASHRIRRKVRLMTAELDSAATVGVLRPVILLPESWNDWSDEELRSVLAHETAHIRSNDFGWTLFAQLITAMHFLHPLVHVLTRHLRLTQELAADAVASSSVGGHTQYATFLARMAARSDLRLRLRAAHAFLPAPRTLFRRIEMLRSTATVKTQISRTGRVMLTSVLIVLMAGFAGLRAQQPVVEISNSTTQAVASSDANGDVTSREPQPLSLEWIPNGSLLAAAIRPAASLQNPAFTPVREFAKELAEEYGIDLNDLDSIAVAATSPRAVSPDLLILRSLQPGEWSGLRKLSRGMVEAKHNDVMVWRGRKFSYFAPDKYTFILGTPDAVELALQTGSRGTSNRFWHEQWNRMTNKPAAFLLDVGVLREGLYSGILNVFSGNSLLSGAWHLLQDAELIVASLTADADIQLDFAVTAIDNAAAERIQETTAAVMVLLRNIMRQQERQLARSRDPQAAATAELHTFVNRLLDDDAIERRASVVAIRATVSQEETSRALSFIVPSIQNSIRASLQDRSRLNLQRIALGLHNYNDTFQQFPPASGSGRFNRGGEYPVSWRVMITPFVERGEIFNDYHFDEPWDSPHNQKITAVMPEVFAHPDSPPDSVHTAYFAVVSTDETLRSAFGRHTGHRIREFTDGTSNSLLVVEAKREVHWAKPEDIEWNPAGKLPQLGGFDDAGVLAALADASVQRFDPDRAPQVFAKLLTINDGHVVDFSQLQVQGN